MSHTVIIGAGPAGLTAAYELARLGLGGVVLEKDDAVGGLSRTVSYKGFRFDIGGHRFFTKVEPVRKIWRELLGEDFLERPRLSRIYYGGHFFDYPLRPLNALSGLGPAEALRVAASFAAAQIFPSLEERSFEQWVVNRFGRRLYEIFFKTYTEKVWGISCREISAEWAAQRIKNLDLAAAVRNAVFRSRGRGGEVITTLIERFHYPRLGPGMMWERCLEHVASAGIKTLLRTAVERIRHDGRRVTSVTVRNADGQTSELVGDSFLSSMPIREVVLVLDPAPPDEVREAAEHLRYRDFLSVVLIIDRAEVFPDNWIYVHAPDVLLGRVQNYKNWSAEMVPDPTMTALGLEYFVQEGDEHWTADDESLRQLGVRECTALGLIRAEEVVDATVIRAPKAYPVYDHRHRGAVATIRGYLDRLENLQLIGRNGQHRYNNQDHSMLTGILAARNVAGADHDVWGVNAEQEYHEEIATTARAIPEAPRGLDTESLLRAAFARFDPVAMGGAVGTVSAVGLFLATAVLLLKGGEVIGPRLALLATYLPGYMVSWTGALIGAVEAGLGGYAFGFVLATLANLLVRWEETAVRRKIELAGTIDPLQGGHG